MPDEELYDLQSDPDEIKNLATSTDPQIQAKLNQLRDVLTTWIKDTHDQGAIPEEPKAKSDGPRKGKKRNKKRRNSNPALSIDHLPFAFCVFAPSRFQFRYLNTEY
jgi:hypothetical protein